VAVSRDPELFSILNDIVQRLGLNLITKTMTMAETLFLDTADSMKDLPDVIHSRLHVIYEKGTKARVIAIGDYYSQSVLVPFMNTLS
jgi:hypothetical protein